jgi:hypothetical protein
MSTSSGFLWSNKAIYAHPIYCDQMSIMIDLWGPNGLSVRPSEPCHKTSLALRPLKTDGRVLFVFFSQ